MRWSVAVEADGDRVVTREEVVDLADAVATSSGVAAGIGTAGYGVRMIVDADSREDAVERATSRFRQAARSAGLPDWPIARVEAVGEDEDEDEDAS